VLIRLLMRIFGWVHRADRALRAKLTVGGWFALAIMVACAVFGLNTKTAIIHQVFGLLVAILIVAAIASLRFRPKVEASRRLPDFATVGEAFEYRLRIASRDRRDLGSFEVQENVATRFPSEREFRAYRPLDDVPRNPFDQFVGYLRWSNLVRRNAGARFQWTGPARLAAGGEALVRLRCLPARRGIIEFQALRLGQQEPLGLMRRLARVPLAENLLVLPRTWPVAPITLPGTRRLHSGGVAFAGRVGDAEEFVGLREYRAGDSPRRIHWKAWARTGKPVIKEYQDEFFVRHALILDTFTGPRGGEQRFETAVSIAASHVVAPRSSESLLDLMFVERRTYTLTLGRGLGSAQELLRALAVAEAARDRSFGELAEAVQLHSARLSGAIAVLLDWDEPRRRLVASLFAAGVPVQVWLVRDQEAPPPDPGPMAVSPKRFRVVTPATARAELAKP
jgi:uncharacterized protein (DUF58 family)